MNNSFLSSATERRKRLQNLEAALYRDFLNAGKILREIRDLRLYRDDYSSFDAYCKERLGHNRAWADNLIGSVNIISTLEKKVDGNLDPLGSNLPRNERQVRELRGLTPEQQIQVINDVSASGQKVTAALIAQHAQKFKTPNIVSDFDEEVDEELDPIESISPQQLEDECQYNSRFEPEEEEQELEEEIENPNEECNSKEAIELCVEYINQLHQEIALLQAENAELKNENALVIAFLKQAKITWTCES